MLNFSPNENAQRAADAHFEAVLKAAVIELAEDRNADSVLDYAPRDVPVLVAGGQGRGASDVAASALVLFAAATVAVTLIALWLVGWALTATAAVLVTGAAWRGKRGGR